MVDQRTAWIQRIHAQLFHQGTPPQPVPLTSQGRICLNKPVRAGHQVIEVALRMIDTIGAELDPLRAELARLARRQPGCRALMAQLRRRHRHLGDRRPLHR